MSRPGAAATEGRGVVELVDLLDAVVYADLFDCAVSEDEIWRFSRGRIDRGRLNEMLAEDGPMRAALSSGDGLWCLRGREPLLRQRPERRRRAVRLRNRGERVAAALGRIPFVRGLLLTGSAAAENAESGADLDLLVLVEPGRIATVFTILGAGSRLLGRDLFCPNHYLTTDALSIDRHDIYVARELAQALPLAGAAAALSNANRWVAELLPNALEGTAFAEAAPGPSRIQRLLERPLRGRLGDRLERRLRALARSRLTHHHRSRGGTVPDRVLADLEAGTQLRFHGGTDADDLLDRYRRGRKALAERLAA